MKPIIEYKRAKTDLELNQILELQRSNIPSIISEDEKKKEGFVTVHHTLEILKAMNDKCAHIIAKHQDKVVGYALCMLKEFKEDICSFILNGRFSLFWKNILLIIILSSSQFCSPITN